MISHDKIEYLMINETTASPEITEKNFRILDENIQGIGDHKIFTISFRQVLSETDTKNFNGRNYRGKDMWNAWSTNPLIQRDLTKGCGCSGEFGHPAIQKGTNELARQMTIDPKNVCWRITKAWMEGNIMMGDCTTVAGGWGDVLRDRALSGVPPMASSRAIGGCDANGNVLPGFTLVTFDAVERPSAHNAYADMSTVKLNTYGLPQGNSMSESAVAINIQSKGFKDFLLTESVSRDKICRVCDTLNLDYDSMVITESSIKISKITDNNRTTIVMPLHKVIGVNHHCLFGD